MLAGNMQSAEQARGACLLASTCSETMSTTEDIIFLPDEDQRKYQLVVRLRPLLEPPPQLEWADAALLFVEGLSEAELHGELSRRARANPSLYFFQLLNVVCIRFMAIAGSGDDGTVSVNEEVQTVQTVPTLHAQLPAELEGLSLGQDNGEEAALLELPSRLPAFAHWRFPPRVMRALLHTKIDSSSNSLVRQHGLQWDAHIEPVLTRLLHVTTAKLQQLRMAPLRELLMQPPEAVFRAVLVAKVILEVEDMIGDRIVPSGRWHGRDVRLERSVAIHLQTGVNNPEIVDLNLLVSYASDVPSLVDDWELVVDGWEMFANEQHLVSRSNAPAAIGTSRAAHCGGSLADNDQGSSLRDSASHIRSLGLSSAVEQMSASNLQA